MKIRADIAALLREGHSDRAIADQLAACRKTVAAHRHALRIGPAPIPTPPHRSELTLEEKWATFTTPTDDGHLLWTGRRNKTSGTPVFTYREKTHTARKVAFRIRTGRDPEGHAKPECGRDDCVKPDHVDDGTIRTRDRAALAALTGRAPRLNTCGRGHEYATHRRYLPDGRSYCGACSALAKGAAT